jgi:hypothetical protein
MDDRRGETVRALEEQGMRVRQLSQTICEAVWSEVVWKGEVVALLDSAGRIFTAPQTSCEVHEGWLFTWPKAGPKPQPAAVELGRKDDNGKPRWDLLPLEAVGQVVDVLTFGEQKYAPDGWRHVPSPRRRYYAAAMRHLVAWWLGSPTDPESGLPHLAHAACCILFLLETDE